MDFSNRNAQAQPAPAASPAAGPTGGHSKKSKSGGDGMAKRVLTVVAVLAVAVVLIAGIMNLASGQKSFGEGKYVDSTKLQAVFLNTGQVYFGKITKLNSRYFVVTNIYYLQTANGANGATNTSVSLVKLGCELHEPYDQMVINRDQVTFWENLQDNGQVAKAVSTFVKQNPSGQKCADQSSSSSNSSSNSVQSAGSNSGNTTTAPKTNP